MRAAGIAHAARHARGMYVALGRSLAEFLWFAGNRGADVRDVVAVDPGSLARLEAARALGRGVIVAASHTGNWELAACRMAADGPFACVVKPLSVGALDSFTGGARRARGISLIRPENALRDARRALSRGEAVGMLTDQVPQRKRRPILGEFLSQEAHLDRAPATLAAWARAPLVVSAARRTGPGKHALVVLDVFFPEASPTDAWIEATTRAAAQRLDAFVRQNPSEWLWLHRRWRAPLW